MGEAIRKVSITLVILTFFDFLAPILYLKVPFWAPLIHIKLFPILAQTTKLLFQAPI